MNPEIWITETPAFTDTQEFLEFLKHTPYEPRFVFFYGSRPRLPDTVDESCFSQWYSSPFKIQGLTYPTAEHWMMASKARMFEDPNTLDKIMNCRTPFEAKALGRQVQNFDKETWEDRVIPILVRGNIAKFGQNPELACYLLQTEGSILVEAAPRDSIYGIGMSSANPLSRDPSNWKGRNLLGFALCAARDAL